jgi:undecaprenyl-diphosphatase
MPIHAVLVLAVVQGLTEFLPVSSKTHLLFARHALGRPVDLFFDITLHVGSLLAILVYYRREWWELLRARRAEIPRLVLASIPVVVVGLLFKRRIEHLYENLALASGMLLATAAWLWASERCSKERHGLLEAPLGGILLVGLAQACAVLPGVSRSGSTIGMGFLAGLRRPDAVRFSFFLGAVAIAGAAALATRDAIRGQVALPLWPILLGVATTFAVSLAAIKVVEKLSLRGRFSWFALYCAMAGIVGLIFFARG